MRVANSEVEVADRDDAPDCEDMGIEPFIA